MSRSAPSSVARRLAEKKASLRLGDGARKLIQEARLIRDAEVAESDGSGCCRVLPRVNLLDELSLSSTGETDAR
jgi:hypothetical protein